MASSILGLCLSILRTMIEDDYNTRPAIKITITLACFCNESLTIACRPPTVLG